MSSRVGLRLALASGALAVLVGCGGGSGGKQAISGEVTYKGKAVEHGQIQFSAGEGQPPLTGAAIENGTYSIPADKGLPPGTYRVSISSQAPTKAPAPDELPGEPPPPAKELLPKKYNDQSTLKAEVKENGPAVLDFKLD